MRVMSLFTGAGGFDLGFQNAGCTIVGQVENDPYATAVLETHWPNVPRWKDINDVNGAELPDFDTLIFGSPCQDLSIAGKRHGLDGQQSALFHQATRIIKEYKNSGRNPTWIVWENVPNALRSNNGRDFAYVLDAMAELGALDIQWRILDAAHFGIPQRRRRIFVISSFDPRTQPQPEILPIPQNLRPNPQTGSTTRPHTPPSSPPSPPHGRQLTANTGNITSLTSSLGRAGADAQHAQNGWLIPTTITFDPNQLTSPHNVSNPKPNDPTPTLNTQSKPLRIAITTQTTQIRKITPLEAERLMGWPDNWTHGHSDTQRYKMTGNGVATPVAQWIAQHLHTRWSKLKAH